MLGSIRFRVPPSASFDGLGPAPGPRSGPTGSRHWRGASDEGHKAAATGKLPVRVSDRAGELWVRLGVCAIPATKAQAMSARRARCGAASR